MKKIKLKPSEIFWNALVFLIVIISAFINIEYSIGEIALITMLSFPVMLRYIFESTHSEDEFVHYWMLLSAFAWFFGLIFIIYTASHWVWDNVIEKTNDWLDSKFSNK
jgi:hypothetical protein